MHPLRLLAIVGIAVPVLAAPPLSLRPGSTREWVRYTGNRSDSVRYKLEFLDSTNRDSNSQYKASYIPPGGTVYVDELVPRKNLLTEWKVRVTIPDSPSVRDTAILHVVGVDIGYDVFNTGSDVRLRNLAYWHAPSIHCPIDVQTNPVAEVQQFIRLSGSGTHPMEFVPNGAWELALMNGARGGYGLKLADDSTFNTSSLGGGFGGSIPMQSGKDSIGITSWLRQGAYWKLQAVDGKPLAAPRRGLGHRLKSGESWVYRDSTGNTFHADLIQKSYISLELLAPLSDSAGWSRLQVRESIHPDSGASRDTTIAILLDTIRHVARIGTHVATPWLQPATMEAQWALGLLRHLIFPDNPNSRHVFGNWSSRGEVPSIGASTDTRTVQDDSIGVTSIATRSRSWGDVTCSAYSSWTLVAHSFDNTILPTSPNRPGQSRDLAWLRSRIAQDPSLEVVRIAPDGSKARARGADALRLLGTRGVGILQVRDGQELVRLRVVRP